MLTIPDWAKLGPLVFTPTISHWLEGRSDLLISVGQMLDLYRAGDWGDLCEEDWQLNIDTIKSDELGGRLMGAYKLFDGRRIWIITSGYGQEHLGPDYCYTTVLAPEDY